MKLFYEKHTHTHIKTYTQSTDLDKMYVCSKTIISPFVIIFMICQVWNLFEVFGVGLNPSKIVARVMIELWLV